VTHVSQAIGVLQMRLVFVKDVNVIRLERAQALSKMDYTYVILGPANAHAIRIV
jgi:hypothetical protein